MSSWNLLAFAALALTLSAGCGGSLKPAQGPEPEYSDEAEYANTPTEGPGAQTSTGYYGVGNSGTPDRTPASPRPAH
jgi:hypothetical protein